MVLQPVLDISTPHVVYALFGGFVIFFGMLSLLLRESLYIGEASCAFLFGIAMGPNGAGLLKPHEWGVRMDSELSEQLATSNDLALEFTRLVLAVRVFMIGANAPKRYLWKHLGSMALILGPVMLLGWLVCAGLIYAIVPSLDFPGALVIAACITPTDPILASVVLQGNFADKHVPAHIQSLLIAESGGNHIAAFPLLLLSLYLIIDSPSIEAAMQHWFLLLWLYQVLLAIIIGGILGFAIGRLLKFCELRDLINRRSCVVQQLSLALLTTGISALLGLDDLLAAFASGTAFGWDGHFSQVSEAESDYSSALEHMLNIVSFIFLGAWIPFSQFINPDLGTTVARLVLVGLLILLLRRLPAVILLYRWIPDLKSLGEALFVGHFGPVGVGALFLSLLASKTLRAHADEDRAESLINALEPIVAFIIVCSFLVHGLSICTFALGKRARTLSRTSSDDESEPEWLNQTRRVERGSDEIRVNRESVMEKGEADGYEENVELEGRASPSASVTVTHVGSDVESSKDGVLKTQAPKGVQSVDSALPRPLSDARDDSPGPAHTYRSAGRTSEDGGETARRFVPNPRSPAALFPCADIAEHLSDPNGRSSSNSSPPPPKGKAGPVSHFSPGRGSYVASVSSSSSSSSSDDGGWASDRSASPRRRPIPSRSMSHPVPPRPRLDGRGSSQSSSHGRTHSTHRAPTSYRRRTRPVSDVRRSPSWSASQTSHRKQGAFQPAHKLPVRRQTVDSYPSLSMGVHGPDHDESTVANDVSRRSIIAKSVKSAGQTSKSPIVGRPRLNA